MEYIKISDLNNIINQYLIGGIFASTLNAEEKNAAANYYGVDLYITKPMLIQLCRGNHILLVKKYVSINSVFDNNIIISEGFKEACSGYLEIVQFLVERRRTLDIINLNRGFKKACESGQLKITQYLSTEEN